MYEKAKQLLQKMSLYFHFSHFPHLHQRFGRSEIIHLNKLRKQFFEIVATDKSILQRLKEDRDVYTCDSLLLYLGKATLPNYEAEDVFEELFHLSKDFKGALLFDVVRRLFSLPPQRWKDFLNYFMIKDLGFYELILLEKAFQDRDYGEIVRRIEKLKELNDQRLEKYLLSKPTEMLEKVAEVFV